MYQIEILALQFFGNRSAGAVANAATIQLTNGSHFGRTAGKEGFIGNIDFVAGDAFFPDLQATVLGQREDGITRNPVQSGG